MEHDVIENHFKEYINTSFTEPFDQFNPVVKFFLKQSFYEGFARAIHVFAHMDADHMKDNKKTLQKILEEIVANAMSEFLQFEEIKKLVQDEYH